MPPDKKTEAWPNELNPCPHAGAHGKKPYMKCPWGVHGRATVCCSNCVWEREEELGSREAALATFIPDPKGSPCKP